MYLSLAPKSNAVLRAMVAAKNDIAERSHNVPAHLRDSDKQMARKLAREGKGYKYPHSFPGGQVEQDYRPAELGDKKYWDPEGGENFSK